MTQIQIVWVLGICLLVLATVGLVLYLAMLVAGMRDQLDAIDDRKTPSLHEMEMDPAGAEIHEFEGPNGSVRQVRIRKGNHEAPT